MARNITIFINGQNIYSNPFRENVFKRIYINYIEIFRNINFMNISDRRVRIYNSLTQVCLHDIRSAFSLQLLQTIPVSVHS